MGQSLRLMHSTEAIGYGKVINNEEAEFLEFKDWIAGEDMQKRFRYVKENFLLGEEHGSLPLAIKILDDFTKNKKSSYCHDDFNTGNIFATDPITIFDPNPRFNNGYYDLSGAILSTIWIGEVDEARNQILSGYFGDESYDRKALHAFLLLRSYYKFPYGNKTKKISQMKNVSEFLLKNKYLLGE